MAFLASLQTAPMLTLEPTPAQRLLVELCRREPSPERVANLARIPGVFAELTAESMRHAIQGLVFSRLAELGRNGPVFEAGLL